MCHKTDPFKLYISVVSSIFTRLCNLPHYLIPKTFLITPKGTLNPLAVTPQPLATTNLLSVSLDLPVLDISYKWNHITCNLLCYKILVFLLILE